MGGPQEEVSPTEVESSEIEHKVTIHRLEMSPTMKEEAISHIKTAVDNHTIEKDIATSMKKHFDEKYEPTWHCIVGKAFGCSVAYDTQYLLFFQIDQQFVLLFKSTE